MRAHLIKWVAATAVMVTATATEARVWVLKSDVPTQYPAKSVLDLDKPLALPLGKKIEVLLRNNERRTLSSADNGDLRKLQAPPTKSDGWFDTLLNFVKGGGGTVVGGKMRSAGASDARDVLVQGQISDTLRICVEDGRTPEFTRASAAAAQSVTVMVEGDDKSRKTTAFKEKEVKLAWPADLPVQAGKRYRVLPANTSPMLVDVAVVARGLTGEKAVQALAEAGCLLQAADALKRM